MLTDTSAGNLIQPPLGLAYDANGCFIQNTGCGEPYDGANLIGINTPIENASTVVVDSVTGEDALIDIRACSQIGIAIFAIKGSLTSYTFNLEFSLDQATWYADLVVSYTAGAVTFTARTFTLTDAIITRFFSMPNPGFNWMRVKTSSVGTTTNSSFGFNPLRGWGNQNMVKV